MFCYQCQEASRGTGCTVRGVCGKTEEVAKLEDLLIYITRGIAHICIRARLDIPSLPELNHQLVKSLFMTITNANFDPEAIERQIVRMLKLRDSLARPSLDNLPDAANFHVNGRTEMLAKAEKVGVLATADENIRSLRELMLYGLKGMAAYTEHALNLGKEDPSIYQFLYEALAATLDDSLSFDDLISLTLKTGEYGVKAMALLDSANTSRYGSPEVTQVNIGVRDNPAILISGHDLSDLEQLLEQTQDTGVDVYTHCEMLPAHAYPAFKKYGNLAGNYGNAWWQQTREFQTFHGPILFTTNCIVPSCSAEVRARLFTTGSAGLDGCAHIEATAGEKKDFSRMIALARTLPSPGEIETGFITSGFAHDQVMALSGRVVEAVRSGAIKKFFVMAGCDGRMKQREYYTEFARSIPGDTVILTAGCAKYRYNKLPLGDINGIPRVLDAGQCNDSYSLALIALKLKEVFGLDDINQLPIAFNIAWYEQKAVIVLLALLYLGVKNIHLGPTLPAFLSPHVARVLVENFGISTINTVPADIEMFMTA